DWYLLWYFAVLALVPASLESYVILLAPLVVGALLVAPPLVANSGERAARKRPWAVGFVVFTVLMIGSLWVVGAKSAWSPNFAAQPLSVEVVGTSEGPVAVGAKLFHDRACLNCHLIGTEGGRRGPNLTHIGSLLTRDELVIRISNGGHNMPAFAGTLNPDQVENLVAFLQSRK
ncbi:MAG: c-type cytochrome, partial [Polyangiaceae bacterium]